MPRRPSEPKPAVKFPRRTAVELAEALGVHRNTVGAWRSEGAPEQLDEFLWRTWAAALSSTGKGYDCPRDPEPALFELLAKAGVGDYRERFAKHMPALGTGEAPNITVPQAPPREPTALTDEQRITRAKAMTAEVEARDKQDASEQRRNRLVHVEALHPLLDAWLLAFDQVIVTGLGALPALCSSSPDVQATVRNALDKLLREKRDQLADETLTKLQSYLEDLGRRAS